MLHNHSVFSVIDGRGTIEDYLKVAKEDGHEFLAITDHGTLGGVIELYTQAKKYGIKPVIGCEMYVDAHEYRETNFPGHMTVLAKNEEGYRALIAANNLAHRQFYQRPRITYQQLIDNKFMENWIVMTGCQSSPLFDMPMSEAELVVKELARHAGTFFLETMWHWSEDDAFNYKQNTYLERVASLHKSTDIPVAITNDCHYVYKQHEDIHQHLIKTTHSKGELEFDGEGFHFKTLAQMQAIADALGCSNALDNAISAGKATSLVIPEADKVNWYVPDLTNGRPLEVVTEICEASLRAKLLGKEYWERYRYEIEVLKTSAAILNSFLVAHDVITWCAERSIPIAARGSMAGSLVSYLMGITLEDPIKYGLSFGRAVNPARPSIPDFDLDVSSLHRPEILDYLKQRYTGNVPIAAYTHYGPKGALRKVLRMENLRSPETINMMSKALPDDWTDGDFEYSARQKKYVGKADWFEEVPEQYRSYVATYRGLYSSISAHPSGVLISGPERELEHEVPLQWIASSKMLVSALDMYSLKKVGLYKLDILGLKTLDQLEFMEKVSEAKVPDDNYDDPQVLRAFGADLLAEIFQMDGYSCREVIKNIRGIETFEDIIAANTLARPGCAQFTPYYRSGYENLLQEYPPLSEVLAPTNGLILYQEQVMEIARILADFNDAEQDDVKESIKYFRKENWQQTIEPLFRSRVEPKGYDPTNILEAISRMASYTYNRAHAMTYAAIAYKMMWYKVYYPAIYYAAVFDASNDKPRLVLESHFFGVEWVPPNVNLSGQRTMIKDNQILLGLGAIKGVANAAFETINRNRPFTSTEDFEARVERKKCNIKVIQSLKDCYALTEFGEHGSPHLFSEYFGFPISFLDSKKSQELANWQMEYREGRLGGYVTEIRSFTVKKQGNNFGKEMGRAKIVNINGGRTAVFFPDVWPKAIGMLYEGSAVKLIGEYQLSGDFIVSGGEIA